jgi:energy-coupling factor transport system substrate-specific component
MGALCIVVNLVLGTVVQSLQIPLIFLDTLGTMLAAIAGGPWLGALVGGLTNVIQGILTNPRDIPFGLVNVAVGLTVGFAARRFKFSIPVAIVTGVVLSVLCPLIGTPIAVWLYGGLAGGGTDLIFLWLLKTGQSVFTAAFLPRIAGNLLDKVASAVIASLLWDKLSSKIGGHGA